MPIAAIILGAMLIDLAFRGTEHLFAAQLGKDFGQGTQFLSWAAAVLILGSIGYVPALSKVSTLLNALVIVALVLRNGGLFAQIAGVIEHPPAATKAVLISSYKDPSSSSGSTGGSSSGGSTVSTLSTVATLAAL